MLVVGSCLLGTKYFVYLNVLQVIKERRRDFCIKQVLWFSVLFPEENKILFDL